MFIIALTGGIEDPQFVSFDTWDEVTNSSYYVDAQKYYVTEEGERVDIIKVDSTHGTLETVESFVY